VFTWTVSVDPLSGMAMAFIENAGNPNDTSGLGGVSYEYRIAIHEVTNAHYVEFLNAVAASDPNGLYAPIMTSSDRGGIERSGAPGSYTYSVKPNFDDKPANGFSWYDAARFCNWLHNGKPTGPQGPATTEDGAYDMSLPGDQIVRKPAWYFIPTHDEWYKAAYYDPFDPGADGSGTPDYWLYPTRSDAEPVKAMANAVGDVTNPGPNVANMDKGADWNEENGNVTTVGGTTSRSVWGLLDMAGNINEQTETPGTPIPPNPPDQPDPLPTRRIRGGDFSNQIILAASPAYLSGSLNMLAEAANIGFRVAARHCLLADPQNLTVDRNGGDLLLSWTDPGQPGPWNVYRASSPDPSGWAGPHASSVTDENPFVPGIQFRDVGASSAGSPLFYRVTGLNSCGESPLD
jgi:formylglycine-generating enzyme required for sulfatase activity